MAGATPPGPTDPIRKPTVTKDQTLPSAPGQGPGTTGGSAASAATVVTGTTIKIVPSKDAGKASDGGALFSITAEPQMPVIRATASIAGITTGPDPTPATEFEWTASVSYDSRKTPNGISTGKCTFSGAPKNGDTRKIAAIAKSGKVTGGSIVVNFDEIRGGSLIMSVTAKIGGKTLKNETKGWRIQGTNPSKSDVGSTLPDDTCRRITCLESGMQQFYPASKEGGALYPYFSGDKCLGVGIGQITNPQPTDDQVWNWRENVKAAVKIYNGKREHARKYPKQVERSPNFLDLERKYNDSLGKAAPPVPGAASGTAGTAPLMSVVVEVPEFTDEQLNDDTIRGYNGWAGDEGFVTHPKELHEFRLQRDANRNLVVVGDPNSGKVKATWERVPASDRPAVGDPNYVNDVKSRNPKTCK